MIDNNKLQPTVKIETTQKRPGVFESTGYVNGKPICSTTSTDWKYNVQCCREDLAEHGFVVNSKILAPVTSARLPKKRHSAHNKAA